MTALPPPPRAEPSGWEASPAATEEPLAREGHHDGNRVDPTDERIAAAFRASKLGASVRDLRLSGLEPAEAHALLAQRGFRGRRVPIPGPVQADGRRQYRLRDGGWTTDRAHPNVVHESIYDHPDGGLVRLFPFGGRSLGLGLMGRVARKALLRPSEERAPNECTLDAELLAISDDGEPLPKSPRARHGSPFAEGGDAYRLAAAWVAKTRIPLGPGEPVLLRADGDDLIGLATTRTLVPADFRRVFLRASQQQVWLWEGSPVLRCNEREGVRFVFPGYPVSETEPCTTYQGLASLLVSLGTQTMTLEAIGPESSVRQLQAFTQALFEEPSTYRIFDEGTGAELTALLRRFPSLLFSAEHRLAPPPDEEQPPPPSRRRMM